jgi:signal transduction histidine kinase
MKAQVRPYGLRFKITLALLIGLTVVLAAAFLLRYVSYRRLLVGVRAPLGVDVQEIVGSQWAIYLRSSLFLSAGTAIVVLLIVNFAMKRLVVDRLRQFLAVVKQARLGDLAARAEEEGSDEIADLARGFNRMAEGLRRQAEELSTLNALAATVSQSLDLHQVLRSALDAVLALLGLRAGWVTLRDDEDQAYHLAASHGLPEEAVLAHTQCSWRQCACAGVFESGRSQVFRAELRNSCPADEYLCGEGLVFRACVPLKAKNDVLGVMSLAGVTSGRGWMFSEEALDMLTAIGRQIGVAIENASLYEELRQTESLRRQLLERGIELQEEERKRIARELHDQTSQRLSSMIMTLGVLGEADTLAEVKPHLSELRNTAAQALEEVHNLALELRPRLLDDLGLLAALRHYLGEFRDRYHMPVDLQMVGLGDKRLPSQVETALYRIAQESLTNAAKHAQARGVGVLLENRDTTVVLIVEDDGNGFDVPKVMGSYVHEGNLGLYGMRERVALLGGTLAIESTPGIGTSVYAEIPLRRWEGSYGQDTSTGS